MLEPKTTPSTYLIDIGTLIHKQANIFAVVYGTLHQQATWMSSWCDMKFTTTLAIYNF